MSALSIPKLDSGPLTHVSKPFFDFIFKLLCS